MTPAQILSAYVLLLLGAISLLAVRFRRARKRFEPVPSQDNVFRCRDCGFVYTDDPDVDRSRCPTCGQTNDKFRF